MEHFEQLDYQQILSDGVVIYSSGTTNNPIPYYQPAAKIKIANEIARLRQKITKSSKIYTCCKLTHAGGLLAQTLPALEIGAKVDIEKFNAYTFVNRIRNYTHTHITPLHAKAIMMTKGFQSLDLTGVWVTCGADPVTWNVIESFVSKGAKFLVNWGMSEIGPIAINTLFDSMEKVMYYKSICPPNSTIMGDVKSCDTKIVNHELLVKGDISIYNDWYATKDKVITVQDVLFYQGRTNKEIDLWNPVKG